MAKSEPKTTITAAAKGSEYQMRRRLRTPHSIRQPSPKPGGSSSVTAASSSAPTARRSWAPRGGSCNRSASITKTAVGTTKAMNGARQPNQYPRSPARIGPTNCPTELAARWVPKTLGRMSTG